MINAPGLPALVSQRLFSTTVWMGSVPPSDLDALQTSIKGLRAWLRSHYRPNSFWLPFWKWLWLSAARALQPNINYPPDVHQSVPIQLFPRMFDLVAAFFFFLQCTKVSPIQLFPRMFDLVAVFFFFLQCTKVSPIQLFPRMFDLVAVFSSSCNAPKCPQFNCSQGCSIWLLRCFSSCNAPKCPQFNCSQGCSIWLLLFFFLQ